MRADGGAELARNGAEGATSSGVTFAAWELEAPPERGLGKELAGPAEGSVVVTFTLTWTGRPRVEELKELHAPGQQIQASVSMDGMQPSALPTTILPLMLRTQAKPKPDQSLHLPPLPIRIPLTFGER